MDDDKEKAIFFLLHSVSERKKQTKAGAEVLRGLHLMFPPSSTFSAPIHHATPRHVLISAACLIVKDQFFWQFHYFSSIRCRASSSECQMQTKQSWEFHYQLAFTLALSLCRSSPSDSSLESKPAALMGKFTSREFYWFISDFFFVLARLFRFSLLFACAASRGEN
jgi:hypothetical protein